MRSFLTILLFFAYCSVFAGEPDTAALRKAVYELNTALIKKDTASLHRLLHGKLKYGHSTGWIETKREVITHLFSGKLAYNNIEQGAVEIIEEDNTALVRSDIAVDVEMGETKLQMKLHVLQVWKKKDKGWVLLSRQSTKI
jgi:hypothetical protein